MKRYDMLTRIQNKIHGGTDYIDTFNCWQECYKQELQRAFKLKRQKGQNNKKSQNVLLNKFI